MKALLKITSVAMVAGSVYATTPFQEEVSVIYNLLAADAPILNDILEARATIWNDTGDFTTKGYRNSHGGNYEDGDVFDEVRDMGMAGNIFRGVALNPDGTVVVQFANATDFNSRYENNNRSASLGSAYNKRLRGHYVKFYPFSQSNNEDPKQIVSSLDDHQEIQTLIRHH